MLYSNVNDAKDQANAMSLRTHSRWTVYEVQDGTLQHGYRTVNGDFSRGCVPEGYTLVSRHRNGTEV